MALYVTLLVLALASKPETVRGTFDTGNTSNPTVKAIKMAIILTSNALPSIDYDTLSPAIGLAVERSLTHYDVSFETTLGLYDGICTELSALAQVVSALEHDTDVILGPVCTDDFLVASKLTTVQRVPLLTGAGSFVDNTAAWPYVMRTAYNTGTLWSFFGQICRQFAWRNVFILQDVESIQYSGTAKRK